MSRHDRDYVAEHGGCPNCPGPLVEHRHIVAPMTREERMAMWREIGTPRPRIAWAPVVAGLIGWIVLVVIAALGFVVLCNAVFAPNSPQWITP